jgi:serine protease Do
VTNINQVDLNLFEFDYDLTLAILLANPDGTVYHRYGGRTYRSPMNMTTLVDLMEEGLTTHEDYAANPSPPPLVQPETTTELIEGRLKGSLNASFGCFHCHYVREARQTLAHQSGTWTPDQFWIWPEPIRLGLTMDQRNQSEVSEVIKDSSAAKAGVQPGDHLKYLAGQRILTKYDIQWVLNQSDYKIESIPFSIIRNETPIEGTFKLAAGWKVGDPEDYQWRVRNVFTEHMNKFLPTPGFIGAPLSASKKRGLNLGVNRFAMRLTKLNLSTFLAGVRQGDIVASVNGRSDFTSSREFYHWCETLRRSGLDLTLGLFRENSPIQIRLSQDHLNRLEIESAPEVSLGFIIQELPSDRGLRVGHVTDASSAEITGLVVGDRIQTADGRSFQTRAEFESFLHGKSPGDLLTLDIIRQGHPLSFSVPLAGKEIRKSDLAALSLPIKTRGQEVDCTIRLKIPEGKHIYSLHRKGFGIPTRVEFRGHGYRRIGRVTEPRPKRLTQPNIEEMWTLDGSVVLNQRIEVTDPERFHLVVQINAQVCDDRSCHELQARMDNDGRSTTFYEFYRSLDELPIVKVE